MDCSDAQMMILDDARGALPAQSRARLGEHLAGCSRCAHEAEAQRAVTDLLEQKVPRHAAPASLRQRLAELPIAPRSSPKPKSIWWGALAGAAAAAAVFVAVSAGWTHFYHAGEETILVGEAVNDHLRIAYSEHPLEIESGGIHQVKPWFTGKLDFAPVLHFEGDDDFPLAGGAVAYFVDRKAAAFAFKRRLHSISLFVFRPDGFVWPSGGQKPLGHVKVFASSVRGFNVLLWQDSGLGYALVSDVDGAELRALALRIVPKE